MGDPRLADQGQQNQQALKKKCSRIFCIIIRRHTCHLGNSIFHFILVGIPGFRHELGLGLWGRPGSESDAGTSGAAALSGSCTGEGPLIGHRLLFAYLSCDCYVVGGACVERLLLMMRSVWVSFLFHDSKLEHKVKNI